MSVLTTRVLSLTIANLTKVPTASNSLLAINTRMSSNTTTYLTAAKTRPLEVKSAPYTPPQKHEIVIKNGAVAINPANWAIQAMAQFPVGWPYIHGFDLAGEVAEIGISFPGLERAIVS